ncbi:ComEC/Rec2 family competence protein [Planktotalea arctica]|uniref:ComEC/Rec2 family competence protein n=1 Tax=Planktotalea arctica TaxID=1481893 RepID=UPI000A16E8CC|nr:ComEC/Rec2 family competence protein [Planktotalea arctica]
MGHRLLDQLSAQMAQGFICSPVVLALGVLLYFQMPVEPAFREVLGGFALALLAGAGLLRAPYVLRPIFWCIALLALGFSVAGWRTQSIAAPVLDWRYYGPVEGRVIGLDRSGSGALRVTLDQVTLGRRGAARTPERVRLSLFGSDAEARPRAGARVMTTAHLSPPSGPAEPHGFDFQRHAWFGQLGGVGYARVPLLLATPPEAGVNFFSIRLALSERVQRHLSGQTGAFAAALMTGDRSGLSQETLQNLRHSNLAHLLAISGLHMGLLAGFVFGALRIGLSFIPALAVGGAVKKLAALGALAAAAGYLGLSGGSVATERAFVMAAVTLGAVMLERRAISLRSVAVAALIILLRRPEAVTGPGFQMSFAATTALVVIFTTLSARNMGRKPSSPVFNLVFGTVVSSGVAGLATLPIAAAHFNLISHYGLIANLVSVPLMGVMVIPLAVLAVCLIPLGLDWIPLKIMGLGLDWILSVAGEVSGWPGAVSKIPAPPDWAFFALCLGLLIVALMVTRVRFIGLAPIAAALLGWVTVERPDVLISDTGTLVGVMQGTQRVLSKEKGAGFVAGVWLENDGDARAQSQAGADWQGAQIGQARIFAASGKRGLTEFSGCSAKDIAVFSEIYEGDAPCTVFDQKRLRNVGSVALRWDASGALKITTARDVAGRRYWNDKALRKARLGH